MSEPVVRTIKDFCQAYGISRSEFYRQKDAGKLKTFKRGSRTLILEEDARRWNDEFYSTQHPSVELTRQPTSQNGDSGGLPGTR